MTTARKILGFIRDGGTQAQASVLAGCSPSWGSRLLNEAGTSYKAACEHFRQGGTVDELLSGPAPQFPESADAVQLQRLDARLQRIESAVASIAQRLGVRP